MGSSGAPGKHLSTAAELSLRAGSPARVADRTASRDIRYRGTPAIADIAAEWYQMLSSVTRGDTRSAPIAVGFGDEPSTCRSMASMSVLLPEDRATTVDLGGVRRVRPTPRRCSLPGIRARQAEVRTFALVSVV